MFLNNIQKMNLVHLLLTFDFFGAVLIPFFTDFGKINFTQIMILQSWFMLWIFLLEIPTGTIADFFGRKISIALSGIITAAAALIYISAPNFYVFLLAEFLWALGSALMSGADTALIYDTLKQEKREKESKKILSAYESWGLAGIFIAAPLGSIMASSFGIIVPMALSAIPRFLGALVILTVPEPKIFRTAKKESYMKILREGISFFSKHKALKILAADIAVVGGVSYIMIWLFQPLLKSLGVPIFYYGFVQAAFVVAQILVLQKILAVENFFGGKKKFLFFSALAVGISFVAAGAIKSLPLALAAILIIGGLGLTRPPVIDSYSNKFIPTSKRATLLSITSMMRRIFIAVVNPAIGIVVDKISLEAALVGIGGFTILFAFFSKIEEKMLKD